MKYVHTNIVTNNWKKLSTFYEKVFQCQVVPPLRDQKGEWLSAGTGVRDAHLKGVHLRLPGYGNSGPTLEIYQYDEVLDRPAALANRKGYGHIAFDTEDVEDTLNNIVSNGGSSFGEIVTTIIEGKGSLTFTYARDPDGNLIELQCWE